MNSDKTSKYISDYQTATVHAVLRIASPIFEPESRQRKAD